MEQNNMGCLVLGVVILFGILLANAIRVSAAEKKMCVSCGYVGKPKSGNAGNFGLEVLLWLLFIIPGLIYSMWRLSNVKRICPRCGGKEMIPPDSPMARQLLRNPPVYQPSGLAQAPSPGAPGGPSGTPASHSGVVPSVQSGHPGVSPQSSPGQVAEQQFCIHCGHANPAHAAFCNSCGRPPKS